MEENINILEKQFQELVEKARAFYPDIDESIATLNNNVGETIRVQDYLNLATQTPSETSSNSVSI